MPKYQLTLEYVNSAAMAAGEIFKLLLVSSPCDLGMQSSLISPKVYKPSRETICWTTITILGRILRSLRYTRHALVIQRPHGIFKGLTGRECYRSKRYYFVSPWAFLLWIIYGPIKATVIPSVLSKSNGGSCIHRADKSTYPWLGWRHRLPRWRGTSNTAGTECETGWSWAQARLFHYTPCRLMHVDDGSCRVKHIH